MARVAEKSHFLKQNELVGLHLCTATMEIHIVFSQKKLRIDLPQDKFYTTILLLGIYPKDASSHCRDDTGSVVFTAALFILSRNWRQPRCPSTEAWIQKIRCMHTMEYFVCLFRDRVSLYSPGSKINK